jgi:thiol-disulfide isomerase/thioredoxin
MLSSGKKYSRRLFMTLTSALFVSLPPIEHTQMSRAASLALYDYGEAPELTGTGHWLNSEPLSIQALRGRVILIDFWTYSCVNCIRTLPYVAHWYERFKDRGFVVIGVHTPEFAFERPVTSLRAAVAHHAIKYPIVQDNSYATWKAFGNEYWPATYLIDRRGHIVLKHSGEGDYGEIEHAIASLVSNDAEAQK